MGGVGEGIYFNYILYNIYYISICIIYCDYVYYLVPDVCEYTLKDPPSLKNAALTRRG